VEAPRRELSLTFSYYEDGLDISRLLARALAEQLQLLIRLPLFGDWT